MTFTSIIDAASLAALTTISYSAITDANGNINKGGVSSLATTATTITAANCDAAEVQRVEDSKKYIESLTDDEFQDLLERLDLITSSSMIEETQKTYKK